MRDRAPSWDCVGADAQAHTIGRELGLRITGHPPANPRWRAFCVFDEERGQKSFLDRNRDIVDETEVLIALPRTCQEELRSGTWATVRYARRLGRQIKILFP